MYSPGSFQSVKGADYKAQDGEGRTPLAMAKKNAALAPVANMLRCVKNVLRDTAHMHWTRVFVSVAI